MEFSGLNKLRRTVLQKWFRVWFRRGVDGRGHGRQLESNFDLCGHVIHLIFQKYLIESIKTEDVDAESTSYVYGKGGSDVHNRVMHPIRKHANDCLSFSFSLL